MKTMHAIPDYTQWEVAQEKNTENIVRKQTMK